MEYQENTPQNLTSMWVLLAEDNTLQTVSFGGKLLDGFEVPFEEIINPLESYVYENNDLRYCRERHLEYARKIKMEDLAQQAQKIINEGFQFEISPNDIVVIPYELEDRLRLLALPTVFGKGIINEIVWTVNRTSSKAVDRIQVTAGMLEGLTISALMHENLNVSILRDVLEPMIRNTQSLEELEKINWEMLEMPSFIGNSNPEVCLFRVDRIRKEFELK